uniref:Uncharacterized protein n=1 Tax=Mycena chlorophos TaxID=658473 RepID=A0ABQ0MBJ2_MYCCL|nr:predicted protein [Mycena chlorophos]
MKQTIADWLKPGRSEALLRIRRNIWALIVIALLSTLVPPLPSLPAALALVLYRSPYTFYAYFCALEVGAVALLSLNILQSLFALKYPRAPIPPSPAPAKSKALRAVQATPQRSLKLSPNSSPQPQKSFSFSTSASMLQSSTSGYPPSPLSTPSRVIQYTMAPGSSTSSLMSSSGSTINTPSPILSSYHGKHNGDYLARSFDGAYLSELRQPESDDEE